MDSYQDYNREHKLEDFNVVLNVSKIHSTADDNFYAVPLSFDNDTNELKVRVMATDSSDQWPETWNLCHTLAGLKKRFYKVTNS